MYIYICMYIYVYIYIYMHICIYIYLFIYMYIYVYTYFYKYIYIYICICIYNICIHIYIYIYMLVTLQHTATHWNTLERTWTRCNTLQLIVTYCKTLQPWAWHHREWVKLQHTATRCNTLQHTATHCHIPQPWAWHHREWVPSLPTWWPCHTHRFDYETSKAWIQKCTQSPKKSTNRLKIILVYATPHCWLRSGTKVSSNIEGKRKRDRSSPALPVKLQIFLSKHCRVVIRGFSFFPFCKKTQTIWKSDKTRVKGILLNASLPPNMYIFGGNDE